MYRSDTSVNISLPNHLLKLTRPKFNYYNPTRLIKSKYNYYKPTKLTKPKFNYYTNNDCYVTAY